jgi:hypothetical protein
VGINYVYVYVMGVIDNDQVQTSDRISEVETNVDNIQNEVKELKDEIKALRALVQSLQHQPTSGTSAIASDAKSSTTAVAVATGTEGKAATTVTPLEALPLPLCRGFNHVTTRVAALPTMYRTHDGIVHLTGE